MTTFVWHDYETFGSNPRSTRASQFASIRTDANFNIIGEPLSIYCQPANDFIPHPEAVLITGITPQDALNKGVTEAEFIKQIQQEFSQPNSCVLGYNNLRFDDEVTRQLLYRNFYDPYAREWQNGNSRWDLIDMVRAFYALRPEGINWLMKEDGSPSFKLEDLTAANNISHGKAHDALSDVEATIELAKLLKQAQPKLFDYLFTSRGKHQVASFYAQQTGKPFLHISSRFSAKRGCAALVYPVAQHATNANATLVFDLTANPQALATLTVEEIQARVFTSTAELEAQGLERLPLKLIHANRCPVVLPAKALTPEIAQRLGIDLDANIQHWQNLTQLLTPEVSARLQAAFANDEGFAQPTDPDLMIYSGGFFSSNDKRLFEEIHAAHEEALDELNLPFEDNRLEEMLFRYRARNWPSTLSPEESQRWEEFRWHKLSAPESEYNLQQLQQDLQRLAQSDLAQEQQFLLMELQAWVESILPYDFAE